MIKKLPIGLQSFQKIREGNYLYVDKTPSIHRLTQNAGVYFLSRPRRFGKSLLLDTMHHLFESRQELFSGLWIEKHWDWSEAHPVISLDFGAGVLSVKELLSMLDDSLRMQCEKFNLTLESKTHTGKFQELIQKVYKKTGRPVVVLIDEYDKPILDSITNLPQAKKIRDILKAFYSILKISDTYLKFVFLTGVTKFSKVSLFSGLNNLNDITLDGRFGDICGWTHQEVLDNFSDYLHNVNLDKLKKWYNGFNFLGHERVYNPYDLLYYFDRKEFKNYWFETATPTFLIKKIQEKQYFIPDIENIKTGEEIIGSFDIETLSLETLLFQAGYLTIQEKKHITGQDIYALQYPNLEIKMSLTNSILTALVPNQTKKTENQLALYESLEIGNVANLENIFKNIFASIPHDWFRKNNLASYEGYYASVVYSYFVGLGLDTIAEDTTNKGRIDLTVFQGNYIYIIEFKVEKSGKGALEQIKERKYWEKYLKTENVPLNKKNTSSPQTPVSSIQHPTSSIYLIGIEFNEQERNVTNFSWEAMTQL